MAAGKRIRHVAWFPAVTFELRVFAKNIRLSIVGPTEDGSRVPGFAPRRLKLLKPHNAASAGLHQLRGLLSE